MTDIVLGQVKLGLNSIKCNIVFSNKIKPLHVSANDGHFNFISKNTVALDGIQS
jgi:hypothetical protein